MLLKNMGHRARSTAEDYRTSLVDPLVDKKQYLVLGMRAHLFPLLRDFYAQDVRRNTEL